MKETLPDPDRPDEAPDFLVKPKFGGVVVLCKACQKRSSGPAKLKAKDLRKAMRREPAPNGLRLRVVESSCLGLCPKKAIAAVAMARGGQIKMGAIRDAEQAAHLVALLDKAGDD